MLFGSNVYSVRFCMPTYLRCQGVGWNILRKIHAYFLWGKYARTKTDSYGGGKKCRKVFGWTRGWSVGCVPPSSYKPI